MRHFITLGLLTGSLLLSACGKTEEKPMPNKPQVGRDETQGIRRTDAIGYSGSAIANKVDGVLNANDAQKAKTDQTLQNNE